MYEGRARDDDRDAARTGVSPALIGFIVVAALAIVFIVQNGAETEVEFLFWSAQTPVWVAIAVAIALGAVLDRLALMWWRRSRR